MPETYLQRLIFNKAKAFKGNDTALQHGEKESEVAGTLTVDGKIDFEGIIRQLNFMGYQGPLTVEWEDPGMHREHGATESAAFCKQLDFEVSPQAFDSAFSED